MLSKNLKIKICRPVGLPFVACGCETWSLTWREKRRLKLFKNRLLGGIFGPRRFKVTGEWRKLHNEELNDLTRIKFCSGDQIEKNEMGGSCSTYREEQRCAQGMGGET